MSYPKKLRQDQMDTLAPIIKQIESLTDGTSVAIRDNASSISTLKHLVYSYLHINGLKHYFKIVTESPLCFRIIKKAQPRPQIELDDAARKANEFAIKYLMETFDEETAIDITKSHLTDLVEVNRAMDAWRRMMGFEH